MDDLKENQKEFEATLAQLAPAQVRAVHAVIKRRLAAAGCERVERLPDDPQEKV